MSADLELFDSPPRQLREFIGKEAVVLRGFALDEAEELFRCVLDVEAEAPFRKMETRGGFEMSVGMTNCGDLGWTTDRRGYRYTDTDPQTGRKWPKLPARFLDLGKRAAVAAGFLGFEPDACLINEYLPGSRLSLHQDKNEKDYTQPIVSVALGVPATFLFGGMERTDKTMRVRLTHGDVTVWGGVDRLRYHGVLPIKSAPHPLVGERRINITFRKAG